MNDRLDRPLSEREVEELDQLLAAMPPPYDPLDVVALDGFLTGLLLQPDPVAERDWLPLVYHAEGRVVPDNETSQRIEALVRRRMGELAACLAAGEPFDPILFDVEDEAGNAPSGRDAIAALEPWASGFAAALQAFPALDDAAENDADIAEALTLIFRHLPAPDDTSAEERAAYEREQRVLEDEVPIADLDEALDLVVGSVLRIDEAVHPRRPQVRETPKVGRNDPCPCGSGRKYKACHGRSAG